jgi:hypothetical protein
MIINIRNTKPNYSLTWKICARLTVTKHVIPLMYKITKYERHTN